jgi:hypothetical protein
MESNGMLNKLYAPLMLLTSVLLTSCAAIQRVTATQPDKIRNENCMESPRLEVVQVVDTGILAYLCPVNFPDYYDDAFDACINKGDVVYMPVSQRKNDYVDDQKVTLPQDKCFSADGTYKFVSTKNIMKTVRKIKIVEAEVPNPAKHATPKP